MFANGVKYAPRKNKSLDYPSYIELEYAQENGVSKNDSSEDKFPECIPRYFIEHFISKQKAKIFDPFMGHGTTAFVAEECGHVPYGIEADDERHEWAAGQIEHWNNIKCTDALSMNDLGFPKMDLCITSPPFMPANHGWNPLYGGDPEFKGYAQYLKKMAYIFAELKLRMKKGANVIVHVDNIHGKTFTPLVRDFSILISQSFTPKGETIIKFKNAPEDYPLTRCLIFKR